MVKKELIRRSPLRILEKAIHGGLKDGNVGVLASRKGVGKTACLVHLSTDKLFQEKPVIHVSYASRVDYIITWYEEDIACIYAQRIDASGDVRWRVNGSTISSFDYSYFPTIVGDETGGAIITWYDNRNINNDIFKLILYNLKTAHLKLRNFKRRFFIIYKMQIKIV